MFISTSSLILALGFPSLVFSQTTPVLTARALPRSTPLPSVTACDRSPVDTLCSPSKSGDFKDSESFDLLFRGRDPDVDGSRTEYVKLELHSHRYEERSRIFGAFSGKDKFLPDVIRAENLWAPCGLNGTYVVQVRIMGNVESPFRGLSFLQPVPDSHETEVSLSFSPSCLFQIGN